MLDRRVREVRRCPGQTRRITRNSLDSSLQLASTKCEQVFALDQPGLPLLLLAAEAVLSTFEISQRALQMFLLKANAALKQQLFAVEFFALSRKCGGLLEPGVTNVGGLVPRLLPRLLPRFRTGLGRIGPSGRWRWNARTDRPIHGQRIAIRRHLGAGRQRVCRW
jgi:hypothetical protein